MDTEVEFGEAMVWGGNGFLGGRKLQFLLFWGL